MPVAIYRGGSGRNIIRGATGWSRRDCQTGWRGDTDSDEASDDASSETHSGERGQRIPGYAVIQTNSVEVLENTEVDSGMDARWMDWIELLG